MKTRIAIALLAATLTGATGTAFALCGHQGRQGGPGARFGERGDPGGRLEHMAAELGLSQEQKTQIEAVLRAQREQVKPLVDELRQAEEQLRVAAEAKNFDEAAFRSLLESAAGIRADVAVSRIKTHRQIDTILTAEQRDQARKLRAEHRPGPRGPRPFPEEE